MKKFKTKNLRTFFLQKYVVVIIISLFSIFVSLNITDFIFHNFYKNNKTFDISKLDDLFLNKNGSINTELLLKYKGSFFILNKDKELVYEKESAYLYNLNFEDIINFKEIIFNSDEKRVALNTYTFLLNENELYYLIHATEDSNEITKNDLKKIIFILIIFFITFISLIFIIAYVFSNLSIKKFKNPLLKIVFGIKEMEKENYKIRLNFEAEKEFAEIRDAFNKMSTQLDKLNSEKLKLENDKKKMLLHLSHDMKTPITSIYGFSKLLYENENIEPEEIKKYLKFIHDKSLYLANLIKDLFELSKIDDITFKLNKKNINITEWLRCIIIELYPVIEQKNISLELNIPEKKIEFFVDDIYMKRVITNIINNSIKYNEKNGKIYLECNLERNILRIKISDNGIGIDESLKEKIFEEFTRGNSKDIEGSGLGLAISKKIIILHKGKIYLESDKNFKTNFIIELYS